MALRSFQQACCSRQLVRRAPRVVLGQRDQLVLLAQQACREPQALSDLRVGRLDRPGQRVRQGRDYGGSQCSRRNWRSSVR